MKNIFIALFLFQSFDVFSQNKCLRFCVSILDSNGQHSNNATFHQSDLGIVWLKLSMFNCGLLDFSYQQNGIIFNNLNSIDKEFDRMYESPLFMRLYKKVNQTYVPFYNYDFRAICTLFESNSGNTSGILMPSFECIQKCRTTYFEELPFGEYQIIFSYVDDYNLKEIRTHKMDSLIDLMCFDGHGDYYSGYYIQFAQKPICLNIIK